MTESTYHVHAISTFADNYVWAVEQANKGRVMLVDPGDAGPVAAWIDRQQLILRAILVTHKHGDHVGGIPELLATTPSAGVYAGARSCPSLTTQTVKDNDCIKVLDLSIDVLPLAGHTLDHIGYLINPQKNAPGALAQPWLFCGDTLFSGGCGRLFEGSPAQLKAALALIAKLPANTLIYPAHEYTLANLRFAQAVNPGNQALMDFSARAKQRLAQEGRTLPTTLADELAINPFLRCSDPEIVASASGFCITNELPVPTDELAVFTALRLWKNGFK